MKKPLLLLLSGAAMVTGTVLGAPPPAEAATGCSMASTYRATGGYESSVYCTGMSFVHGFGTTPDEAIQQAQLLYQLYLRTAMKCDGSSATTATGGYQVRLYCGPGPGWVDGFASTTTQASIEAANLAAFHPTGVTCTGASATAAAGGYEVMLHCGPGPGWVSGFGTTASDAAYEARALAWLYVRTKAQSCTGMSASKSRNRYSVTLYCSPGGWATAEGSTLTGAARAARSLTPAA